MTQKLLSPALCAILILSVLTVGCSNKNIVTNIQAVVTSAHDIAAALPNDPRLAKVLPFINAGQEFLDAYTAAPAACIDLASRAAALVSAFQIAILPLLNVSATIAAAIVAIDVALRVIAANFHTCIQSASARAAKLAAPPPALQTIGNADQVFTAYLATAKARK